MIVNDPSRMYAALRCIESEFAKEVPSIVNIRAIVLEASRELRPTQRAADGACAHRELYPSGRCVFCLQVVEQVTPRR